MAVPFCMDIVDEEYLWRHFMNNGDVPEPEYATVPVEEKYDILAFKNILREAYGRHRCPACGKAFFLLSSTWKCHQKVTAYKLWQRFGHARGSMGFGSLSDAVRSGAYSGFGGPMGPFGP